MWLSAGGEQRAPRKKRKLNFKPKSWENKRHRAAPQRPLMTEKPVSQRPVLFYFYARVLNDYCELLTKRMSLLLRKRPLSFPGFKTVASAHYVHSNLSSLPKMHSRPNNSCRWVKEAFEIFEKLRLFAVFKITNYISDINVKMISSASLSWGLILRLRHSLN